MTTSKRISLMFAGYVTLVVIVFGVIVNVIFFVSWYSLVSKGQTLPPKHTVIKIYKPSDTPSEEVIDIIGDQHATSLINSPQDLKLMKRFSRRPLMGLSEPLIIDNPQLAHELQEYEAFITLINYKDQIWHYRIDQGRIVLVLVDPLIDSQLMLIYITLSVAFTLALMSYWVSMKLVRRGLKPLYDLSLHIHSTQDPEQYEHMTVGPDQDELQQLSVALTHAMNTIARQTRSLKQFVTHASHELKTPLMTISSSIDLMIKAGVSHHQTQTIKQTTTSMRILIDRLMATMRNDSLQTQELNMNSFIRTIIDRVSTSYHYSHQCDLSLADPLIKHADPMISESIIVNLVDNAHKYAVQHTIIQIVANTEQCIISNQIDPTIVIDLEQIWQPFYQGDSSQTDIASHGLGLSIVKQYVQRAGWKIRVEVVDTVISFIIDWN